MQCAIYISSFASIGQAGQNGDEEVDEDWPRPRSATTTMVIRPVRFPKSKLRDVTWQRKVDPILDKFTLERLVLDLSDSFCEDDSCKCRLAGMAILCFRKGFALQAPKAVEIKGWDAGRPDIDAMVRNCLGI